MLLKYRKNTWEVTEIVCSSELGRKVDLLFLRDKTETGSRVTGKAFMYEKFVQLQIKLLMCVVPIML